MDAVLSQKMMEALRKSGWRYAGWSAERNAVLTESCERHSDGSALYALSVPVGRPVAEGGVLSNAEFVYALLRAALSDMADGAPRADMEWGLATALLDGRAYLG